jgi:hypothetical protein
MNANENKMLIEGLGVEVNIEDLDDSVLKIALKSFATFNKQGEAYQVNAHKDHIDHSDHGSCICFIGGA